MGAVPDSMTSEVALSFARASSEGEPPWLAALRESAGRAFVALAVPLRTDEAWHYGDPRRFNPEGLYAAGVPEDQSGPRYSRIAALLGTATGSVLCAAGTRLNALFAGTSVAAEGVTILPLAEAVRKLSWVRDKLEHAIDTADRFGAAHLAALNEGFAVEIAPNTDAGVIHLVLPQTPAGSVNASQVLIKGGRASRAEICIYAVGEDHLERGLQFSGVNAEVGPEAHIGVSDLVHAGHKEDVLSRLSATVLRGGHLQLTTVQLGGRSARTEVDVELAEPGAEADLLGAYLAHGKEQFDFLTHQNHAAPHTRSNLLYKGALLGRSRASYQGTITVGRDSQRADAYQSNRVLILSQDARADSSPQLEIGANDVRCTHGSTVSNISDLELFYLASRGISPELGRKLLVSGFIAEVADRIPLPALREYVYSYVQEQMG